MSKKWIPFQVATLYSKAFLAITLISGCSFSPTYVRPEVPVAEQWPATAGSLVSHAGTPNTGGIAPWNEYFSDPQLRQLIETALANNRDLRVAILNIEQARAQLGLRRADQFPTLNAVATGSRTPGSNASINSAYAAGLSFSAYEIDFFGRVESLKEQALSQYLATSEASQTARISLVSSVALGWLALLADDELLSVSRQTWLSREESLKLVELRLRHGAASELDLRLAQTLLESARVTLAQQTRQRALDENALVLLTGQALPASLQAPTNPSMQASESLANVRLTELPVGLPSDLLMRRPDVLQAEQLLVASHANIGAARAAFFPRISLTSSVGSASNDLQKLLKDGSWGWTLAPQLVLPIFDAGRNQANLDAAKAARDIALAQYEKAIQSAFREVADALAGRSTLVQQLQAQQALLTAEVARNRLTRLRLDSGVASQLDWLDAQRALFLAQQGLVQTRLLFLQNQITLYKALG